MEIWEVYHKQHNEEKENNAGFRNHWFSIYHTEPTEPITEEHRAKTDFLSPPFIYFNSQYGVGMRYNRAVAGA